MPAFSVAFLKRLRALSMDSPSFTRIPATDASHLLPRGTPGGTFFFKKRRPEGPSPGLAGVHAPQQAAHPQTGGRTLACKRPWNARPWVGPKPGGRPLRPLATRLAAFAGHRGLQVATQRGPP